ncbi:hypothetical protein [Halorientalis halophila]
MDGGDEYPETVEWVKLNKPTRRAKIDTIHALLERMGIEESG